MDLQRIGQRGVRIAFEGENLLAWWRRLWIASRGRIPNMQTDAVLDAFDSEYDSNRNYR
jgi:hypothetical protein